MSKLILRLWHWVPQNIRTRISPFLGALASRYPSDKRSGIHPEVIALRCLGQGINALEQKKALVVALSADYDNDRRGASGEFFSYGLVLEKMGFTVRQFDPYAWARKCGKKTASEGLYEVVGLFNPSTILYFHYLDIVDHEIWKKISAIPEIKTAIFYYDDDWRHGETRQLEQNFNAILSTWPGAQTARPDYTGQVIITQFGINPDYHRDLHLARDIDVSFIGQKYGNRERYISYLMNKGIHVEVFGWGWEKSRRLNMFEMVEILNRSKITINFSEQGKGAYLTIKGRVFEATACGACLLTQSSAGIERYFTPDKEIICFRTEEELHERVLYLLKNDAIRKEIAVAGQERTLKEHTNEKRLQMILDRLANPGS